MTYVEGLISQVSMMTYIEGVVTHVVVLAIAYTLAFPIGWEREKKERSALAFAQLWYVFNMREVRSKSRNEITCNPWVWSALGLCTALLAAPPYIPHLAHILDLVRPTPAMWAIVVACSLAPLLAVQAVILFLASRSPVGR